jgi:predicted outer membrane protein
MSWKHEVIAVSGCLLLVLPAQAQTGKSSSTADQKSASQPRTSGTNRDAELSMGRTSFVLAFIHQADQDEIEMASLVKDRSSNDAVKNFADQMTKDHRNVEADLEAYAKSHNIDLKKATDQFNKACQKLSQIKEDMLLSREVQSPLGEYARPFGPEGLGSPNMHQEEMDELRKLKGPDFDRQFLRDVVSDHERVIRRLKMVRSRSTDNPDLSRLIDKLLPVFEQHESAAQRLETSIARTAG